VYVAFRKNLFKCGSVLRSAVVKIHKKHRSGKVFVRIELEVLGGTRALESRRATITSEPFYERLLEHFDKIGAYHVVWEEE